MLETKVYRKSKHTLYVQKLLFPKIFPFMRYVGKYGRDRQATNDYMTQGRCDLHTITRYSLVIFNNYFLSTVTMVTRTHLRVTSYYISCIDKN
jgi:hypothetical protein